VLRDGTDRPARILQDVTVTREPEVQKPARVPSTPAAAPHRLASTLSAAAGPLLTLLLALVAAAQALQWWGWRPGTPLSLQGDAPQVLTQIQAILDGDWYRVAPHVGAPFGMNQAWFTTADVVNFAMIRVIGLFTGSAATAGAVYFALGFPAAALTAYWLGRRLTLSRPAAVTVGVLFAVLPGHQEWFPHLWLASYWMVPLAVWLIVEVARGGRIWPTRAELRAPGDVGRAARRLAALTAGVTLAVGLSDVYYVAFTLLLLAIALVFRRATGTPLRSLVPAIAATASVAVLCGASLFAATRGRHADQVTGALPASRVIGESEQYAGKLIELLLPWHDHRVGAMHFVTYAYGLATGPSVERPALGVVALCGVAALVLVSVAALAQGRAVARLWGLLTALTLVSLAFYIKGGLGSVVALFVTPQIRTWSRFVVLIGLFGLLAVGLWLTRLGRRRGRRVAWVAASLVLAVGVLDQTNPGVAPHYDALRSQLSSLQAFSRTIADRVGPGCQVFQLPVVSFPEEPPPGTMGDYDHLLPSLASPAGLQWSYGAIRGTSRADWQLALPVNDPQALLGDLAAAGFCAVEVDRDGYAATTDPTPQFAAALGAAIADAPSDHLVAYDLRRLAAGGATSSSTSQRDQVLHPVVASLDGSLVDTTEAKPFQWTGPQATVKVANLGRAPVAVTLTFDVAGTGPVGRTVTVTAPGSSPATLRVSDTRTGTVTLALDVPPGTSLVRVTSTGDVATVPYSNGQRFAALKVTDLRLSSTSGVNVASLQQFAAASPPSTR
jgi:hypothetical protein